MNSDQLHAAICQAVSLLNISPAAAKCSNARDAHNILRETLVAYADAYMDQPAPEAERSAVARKHQKAGR